MATQALMQSAVAPVALQQSARPSRAMPVCGIALPTSAVVVLFWHGCKEGDMFKCNLFCILISSKRSQSLVGNLVFAGCPFPSGILRPGDGVCKGQRFQRRIAVQGSHPELCKEDGLHHSGQGKWTPLLA